MSQAFPGVMEGVNSQPMFETAGKCVEGFVGHDNLPVDI